MSGRVRILSDWGSEPGGSAVSTRCRRKGLEGFISHLQIASVLFMWSRVHLFLYFTYVRVSFSCLSSKKVLKSLKVVLLL